MLDTPTLDILLPPAEVVVDDHQAAVVEAVTIQRQTWDHFQVEYHVQWWEDGQKKEETVSSYFVTSAENPAHIPIPDKHPFIEADS